MPDPMEGRVRMMVSRGVLSRIDDSKGVQAQQVEMLDDEVHDDVERVGEYGFTSVPLEGAEAVIVCVGGLRSHGLVIGVEDRRHRKKNMQPGEVAIYDDLGQCVVLKRDGIEIISSLQVKVTAPKVVVNSNNVNLGGEGGKKVARIGDTVADGVITGGSSKVRAID